MEAIEVVNDELKINIFPRQAEFIASTVDDALFGGAAGGGKSHALLIFSGKRRMEYPGTNGIIFRRTFPELDKSIIRESLTMYPHFGAKYNSSKREWRFPNGSIQEFGYCERDGDVYKYQSAEYEDMCFDELTHMTQFQFSYLTSRVRTSKSGIKPLIRCATNPGNIGHQWVWQRYIEPSLVHKIWKEENTGKTMTFIPAKIADNPALSEADPGYMRRLKELPEKKYLALAEGRWDVFEGAYFPEWDPTPGMSILHGPHIPEKNNLKYIGMDWGYADPAAIYWAELTPNGKVYVYRELYVTQLGPKKLAKAILDMCPKDEQYEWMSASPEIWGKKTELDGGGEPIQQIMQGVFGDRINMQKANNARVPGWMKMREYMMLAPDGRPWMQVSPDCHNLIRTIPGMIHSDKKPEDMSERGEDHPCVSGETLIQTKKGKFPIKDLVGTEGKLWTVEGWKKYSDCRMTRKNTETVRLKLIDGSHIEATPDHRVLTYNGWKRIDCLRPSDLIRSAIWESKKSVILFNRFKVSGIINAVRISKKMALGSIVKFGNSITEGFLAGIMSITRTMIDRIIPSQTSNYSKNLSICLFTLNLRKIDRELRFTLNQSGISPKSGIEIQKITKPILESEKKHGNQLRKKEKLPYPANGAKKSIKHIALKFLNFVTLIVKCSITEDIMNELKYTSWNTIEPAERQNVYNLEVEDVHSFAVNDGIVAHNCEGLRYLLVSLSDVPKFELNPYESNYDKIFGRRTTVHEAMSNLPVPQRGY